MQEIYKSADYIAMYYKKVNNIGIRRKKPRRGEKSGKQIFTFGAGLGLPEARLKHWGGKMLQNLDEGAVALVLVGQLVQRLVIVFQWFSVSCSFC